MARPTKFDADVAARILTAIRVGNYMETAAAHAGISKDTLYAWLRKGARAKSGPLREFSDAVQKAIADAEVRNVAVIQRAAQKHWQAAAWHLERTNHERWGRKDTIQHTGKDGGPVRMTHTGVSAKDLTDEELAAIEPVLAAAEARRAAAQPEASEGREGEEEP
jgi:transposase